MNIINSFSSIHKIKYVPPVVVYNAIPIFGLKFGTTGGATVTQTVSAKTPAIRNGTYVFSCSSEFGGGGDSNFSPANPFSDPALNIISGGVIPYWASNGGYNANGTYPGTSNYITAGGTKYYGEWLKIQFPFSFVLSYYNIQNYTQGTNRQVVEHRVFGSSDGINWGLLDTQLNRVLTIDLVRYDTPTVSTAYKYYAIVIGKLQNGTDGYATVTKFQLFSTVPIGSL